MKRSQEALNRVAVGVFTLDVLHALEARYIERYQPERNKLLSRGLKVSITIDPGAVAA